MGRVKRIWYLSPMRAAKVQASLRIRAVSPEPPLLAHTSSESRGTFRQKARSLAPLNGWACAVKICHDGMLEDTKSLDAAQIMIKLSLKYIPCSLKRCIIHVCILNGYAVFTPFQTTAIIYITLRDVGNSTLRFWTTTCHRCVTRYLDKLWMCIVLKTLHTINACFFRTCRFYHSSCASKNRPFPETKSFRRISFCQSQFRNDIKYFVTDKRRQLCMS